MHYRIINFVITLVITYCVMSIKACGGRGEYSEVKYTKCQDLPKFQFSGGGGGVGWGWGVGVGGILISNTQSAKICLNFNFLGGGGRGGYSGTKFQNGCSGEFGQKFTVCTETCLCITDSLSHVETIEIDVRRVCHRKERGLAAW